MRHHVSRIAAKKCASAAAMPSCPQTARSMFGYDLRRGPVASDRHRRPGRVNARTRATATQEWPRGWLRRLRFGLEKSRHLRPSRHLQSRCANPHHLWPTTARVSVCLASRRYRQRKVAGHPNRPQRGYALAPPFIASHHARAWRAAPE